MAIEEVSESKSEGLGFQGLAWGGDAGIMGMTGAWEAGTGVCFGYFRYLICPVKWSVDALQVAQNGEL